MEPVSLLPRVHSAAPTAPCVAQWAVPICGQTFQIQLHNESITTLVLPAAVYIDVLPTSECHYGLAHDAIPVR